MLDQLKGVDQILTTVCEELGLPHSLTLLHRYVDQYLIARSKYTFHLGWGGRGCSDDFLDGALRGSTIEDVEGVKLIGEPFDRSIEDPDNYDDDMEFLLRFYRHPAMKILKIPNMPTGRITMLWPFLGEYEPEEYEVGDACMLIALDLAASCKQLVL